MKRILFSIFYACLAIMYAKPVHAAVYYVADCQAGAASGCVAGNDSNNGTSAATAWRTTAKLQSAFNGSKPGDQFLLAKGGAWSAVSMSLLNPNTVLFTNPLVIDSYTASWGGTVKPILTASSGANALDFTNTGAPPITNGGYIVRNLSLQGAGVGDTGVRFFNGAQHVVIENLTVNGFNAGLACGGLSAAGSEPSFITVRNSTFTNNRAVGVGMWGCPNTLIEGNTLDNNGFTRPGLDHPMYVSGNNYGAVTSSVVIRNNKFTNNAVTAGLCQSAVIVGHDLASDWTIEGNYIYQAPGTAYPTCWGIAISPGNGGYTEGMDRLVIRGNTIVNVGNNGVEVAACRTCTIENNVLVWEATTEAIAIRYHVASTTPTYVGTALTVRNNSVYFAKTSDVSRGLTLNDQGVNHVVVSNLVYFGAGSVAASCFDTNLAASSFTTWGNNLCFGAPPGKSGPGDVALTPKLAAVPSLVNGFSMALAASSPAIGKGDALRSAPRDVLTCLRAVAPAIGAADYFSSTCAKAPATAINLH